MSVVPLLRRLDELTKAAYEDLLSSLKERRVTLILFGSRASGTHTLLSDYDLLAIYDDEPVKSKGLTVNVFNVKRSELTEKLNSPMLISALLGGKIILDNLNLSQKILELKEELKRRGAKLESDRIILPRSDSKPN